MLEHHQYSCREELIVTTPIIFVVRFIRLLPLLKTKSMKNFILYVSLLLVTTKTVAQYYQPALPPPIYTGILQQSFDFVAATQKEDQWCWAASIQMVFNYYGLQISQEDIVRRTFGLDFNGNLINRAATDAEITNALNAWGIDYNGIRFTISAQYYLGAPIPSGLVSELNIAHPIIVAYRSGPNTGHAVVLTACSYLPTTYGPNVQSIIVRDPWPSHANILNKGRKEYFGTSLVSQMEAYWIIQVY